MLPVTTGAGLTPGEASSVAPRPIPTGEIGAPAVLPSGEVTPIVGVGRAIPVTCASAPPPAKKATQAATKRYLMGVLHCDEAGALKPVDGRTHSLAVLHDHRVNPVFDGGNLNGNPPRQVHSSLPGAGAGSILAGQIKDVGARSHRS